MAQMRNISRFIFFGAFLAGMVVGCQSGSKKVALPQQQNALDADGTATGDVVDNGIDDSTFSSLDTLSDNTSLDGSTTDDPFADLGDATTTGTASDGGFANILMGLLGGAGTGGGLGSILGGGSMGGLGGLGSLLGGAGVGGGGLTSLLSSLLGGATASPFSTPTMTGLPSTILPSTGLPSTGTYPPTGSY